MLKAFKAATAYFGLVFGAGFLLGCIRVPLIVPRLGVRAAELLEMPIELMVIVWASRFVVRRFSVPSDPLWRLSVGLIALGMVVAAELVLAVVISGQPVAAYIAGRDPVSGSVYLLVLAVFALMPLGTRHQPPEHSASR